MQVIVPSKQEAMASFLQGKIHLFTHLQNVSGL